MPSAKKTKPMGEQWLEALLAKDDAALRRLCGRHNVNAKYRSVDDGHFTTALIEAVSDIDVPGKKAQLLLDLGADPNIVVDDFTALDIALDRGRKGVIAALKRAGARPGAEIREAQQERDTEAFTKKPVPDLADAGVLAAAIRARKRGDVKHILDTLLFTPTVTSKAHAQAIFSRGINAAWQQRDLPSCIAIVQHVGMDKDVLSLDDGRNLLAEAIQSDQAELVKMIAAFHSRNQLLAALNHEVMVDGKPQTAREIAVQRKNRKILGTLRFYGV